MGLLFIVDFKSGVKNFGVTPRKKIAYLRNFDVGIFFQKIFFQFWENDFSCKNKSKYDIWNKKFQKNLKIGKFSFVDIFQKSWTFADISTCPSERRVFSLSFASKFEYLRRPSRSGEQIDQETIFEFILPAGVKKNCYPQGLKKIKNLINKYKFYQFKKLFVFFQIPSSFPNLFIIFFLKSLITKND